MSGLGSTQVLNTNSSSFVFPFASWHLTNKEKSPSFSRIGARSPSVPVSGPGSLILWVWLYANKLLSPNQNCMSSKLSVCTYEILHCAGSFTVNPNCRAVNASIQLSGDLTIWTPLLGGLIVVSGIYSRFWSRGLRASSHGWIVGDFTS